MLKLLCTFALWFVGGLLAVLALLSLVKPGAWVLLLAIGVLGAALSPRR